MPNTPKLPEDVEKRFDTKFSYEDENGDMRFVTDWEYYSGNPIEKSVKKFIAQELATLKAQVRKEIEDRIGTKDHACGFNDGECSCDCWNQAVADCLSIKSLEEE